MTVQPGDRVPEATLKTMTPEGIQDVSSRELFEGKKVVLFSVPGAFTPTCSDLHRPSFVDKLSELKARGVDTVACVAVNDPFVMSAWRRARNIPDDILLLSDGNGDFARAMGLDFDASRFGMGTRSRRYAAVVEDGVIQSIGVEPGGEVTVSGAEAVLQAL